MTPLEILTRALGSAEQAQVALAALRAAGWRLHRAEPATWQEDH